MILNVCTFEEEKTNCILYVQIATITRHGFAHFKMDAAIGCWVGGPVTALMLTSDCIKQSLAGSPLFAYDQSFCRPEA